MRALVVLLAGAISLCAGDVTGKWKGAMIDKEGQETDFRVFLILKQEGSQLTGTAGNDEYDQVPIRNGSVQGETVQFEVATDDALYKVALRLENDDLIQGQGTVDRSGEQEKFRVAVKRVKERAGNAN
jgi:hypothetical protein